jgi:hypothetical protein
LLSHSAKEVSATHNDGDLHTEFTNLGQFRGNLVHARGIDTETLARGQCLTGQLEQDAFEDGS